MRNAARLQDVSKALVLLIVGLAAMEPVTSKAADIRVFSGGAPQETLQALTPAFEKQTGHRVTYTFAHVSIIQKKLAAGEQTEVILLPTPLMAGTGKVVPLRPEGRSVLARIGIGVLIRDGSKRPDISTADAVRRMLLKARSMPFRSRKA